MSSKDEIVAKNNSSSGDDDNELNDLLSSKSYSTLFLFYLHKNDVTLIEH